MIAEQRSLGITCNGAALKRKQGEVFPSCHVIIYIAQNARAQRIQD
jgi:hypothetical protein